MPEIDLGPIIGPQGPQGATGPAGATGPGVPAGGTAGQIVTKKSSTGFDAEWRSPVNDANQTEAGYVLDARMGKTLGDAIDEAAKNTNIGSFSNIADFNSALDSMLAGMRSDGVKTFQFSTTAAFEPFANGTTYVGTMYKSGTNTTFSHMNIRQVGGIRETVGRRDSSGWAYNAFALASDIGQRKTIPDGSNLNSYTVAAGGNDQHYVGTNINSIQSIPGDIPYSTNSFPFTLDVASMNGYSIQVLTIYGTSVMKYQRQQYYSGGYQWTSWEKFALKSDIEVKETTVSGSLKARKFGKVVCLNGYAQVSISGQTVIGDALPQEYRPSDVIRGICNVGTNAYSANKIAYVAVGSTSGQVEVTPPDSGSYSAVYMSLSWVVTE